MFSGKWTLAGGATAGAQAEAWAAAEEAAERLRDELEAAEQVEILYIHLQKHTHTHKWLRRRKAEWLRDVPQAAEQVEYVICI